MQAFFEEERRELERKRAKIRLLQQRKTADVTNCKDLPGEIPLQLVIGTKVTARLRRPQDGLFNGSIDAVDTSNNTYRITFERPGLGTHSVPDFEVLSNEPPETITVSSFAQKFRPRNLAPYMTPPRYTSDPSSPRLNNDPLLAGSPITKTKSIPSDGTVGGFPVKFLEMLVRLSKILNVKKTKIKMLREMNSEAEKRKSFGSHIPEDFQHRYAKVIAPEPSIAAMLAPSHLQERSQEEAHDLSLSDADRNAYEMKVLHSSMEEIRSRLSPGNQHAFRNCVEIHMQHIQLGLGHATSMHPFMIQRV
ncbi:Protein lin-9 [Blattella germanica]|nr:Protein lin-9 [Blattella germanica]